MSDQQMKIRKVVQAQAGDLTALAQKIHKNPELGYEEGKACRWQIELLRKKGFKVQAPVAGIKTAFKAVHGKGKPVFAFLSEYDALPGIGHGCGHNLIAAAAVGAGLALAETMRREKLKGTVVVLGTPAEESKGGKVHLLKHGAFKDVDCAVMAHPSWRSALDQGSTAIRRFKVRFHGQSSHAAAAPEHGRNALDAVMLLFQGINAWRQHLTEGARIHGIVDNGGVLPNIIPDLSSCVFFLRSTDDKVLNGMERRFRDIVRGAGLMTETRPEIEAWLTPYKSRWYNAALNEAYWESAGEAGLCPVMPAHGSRGSTDFGDVSHAMPGGHFYFGIAPKEIPGHSKIFARAAGSAYGMKQMLKTAEALAVIGRRYLVDNEFRRNVNDEFQKRRKSVVH